MNDKEIVTAIRQNPEKGFRLFMDRYKEPLYWHIRRLVVKHDDAQDASQETFVRIFRSINGYKGGSFTAWVYRIATNEALRILDNRKKIWNVTDADGDIITKIPADEYVDCGDRLAIKLQKAIHSLPAKQQLTFNLRYYDELGYDEIAEAVGSTAAAAKANYHVAKEKITEYMNSND